ncbi:MAG: hypothetical protein HUU46_12040 [Candidatus Hydrogenedentes bacterium]|nr:hypothetical protein [Candidatus Hydrogenedentota bacterium]
MPNFATESDVRLRFQLNDAALVPADLIEACIDDAHREIERFLDPEVDADPPDQELVTGETLLAGAYLYRALAAKDAFCQRNVTIGGQRIEEGERFRALMAIAALTEKQAWFVLEPYLAAQPVRLVVECTESAPVLGDA